MNQAAKLDGRTWQNPKLAHVGGFEALEQELAYRVPAAEIDGRIPDSVRGTFFRIGPGRNRLGDQVFGHWFDGDGMLHGVTFTDDGIWYRNRYVRTPKYLAETAAGKIVYRSFGHNAPGGVLKNIGRTPANAANTSLVWHGGRLLALWEGGRPWQVDPVTLETIGEFNYGGKLGFTDPFSAHGKIDPNTGYYYNHGLGVGARGPQINIYRINPDGELVARAGIPVKVAAFVHDCAFAGDYLVYFVHPVGFRNPLPFLSGVKAFNDCIRYNPDWGMEALVVEAATLKLVKRIPLDPFVVFHFGNAWQEDQRLVIDLMRFEDFSVNAVLSDIFHAENEQGGRPWRYTLDLATGEADAAPLPFACGGEFPQWDLRFSGRKTRWLFTSAIADNGTNGFFNAIQRLDTETGGTTLHDFGPGRFTSEAVFVPEGSAEGDGYLCCVVYDAAAQRSEIVLLDARAEGLPQLARIPLRNHVPLGFHCGYTRKAFLPA
jgi:all-trans-8'-apo-beta-carotenal 15,15'-oxygenase